MSRYETYLRKIAGEDVDISNMPEPSDRYEYYLKQIAENGGGSVDPEEIAEIVTDWLDDHVDPETGYVIDDTLLVEGAAADAKKVGDELTDVKSAFTKEEIYAGVDLATYKINTRQYLQYDKTIQEINLELYIAKIPVNAGQKFKISGQSKGNVALYGMMDSSDTVLSVFPDTYSSTTTLPTYTDVLVEIPNGVAFLVVNINGAWSIAKTVLEVKIGDEYKPNYTIRDTLSYVATTLSMTEEKLLNGTTGEITASSGNTSYRVSDYVDISSCKKVMVTTEHFWSQGIYAFYDSEKVFISGVSAGSGGTKTKLYNKIIDVPEGAAYIVIGFLYDSAFPEPFLFKGVEAPALPSAIWSNKKWAMLGDSLTEYNSKASMHYYDYIKGCTGIKVENLAVSGTGYAKGGSYNFATLSANVPSDADVVTIFGSFNDLSSGVSLGTVTDTGTSTIAGCINTTLDNIQTAIPLANIGVIAPTPWSNTQPTTSGSAFEYVEMIKAICNRRSIPFLDLWRESNLRPWDSDFLPYAYSNDGDAGVHPDNNGHKLIAPRIKAFLESLLI